MLPSRDKSAADTHIDCYVPSSRVVPTAMPASVEQESRHVDVDLECPTSQHGRPGESDRAVVAQRATSITRVSGVRASSMRSRSLCRRLSSIGPGIPCVAGRRPGHCQPPRFTPTGPQPCRLFQPGSHRWGVRRRRPVASSASVRPCSQRPAPQWSARRSSKVDVRHPRGNSVRHRSGGAAVRCPVGDSVCRLSATARRRPARFAVN